MEQGKADESNGPIEFLTKYGRFFLLIVAVVGAAWAIVQFFIPSGDVDITVWLRQEIPVVLPELPEEAEELSLMLTFAGEPISHASILDVTVFNSGSEPIGADSQWEFAIRSEDGARIILLGEPELQPGNLDVTVSNDPTPDTLLLQLGLFNPDDSVGLRMVIVEPENADRPGLVAETRLPNLKEPFLTRETELSRFENAFFVPLFFLTLAIGFVGVIVYQWKDDWDFFRTEDSVISKAIALVVWVVVWIFASGFIAFGIAWLLGRIAFFVANN
jgi:hypothetical protein